MDDPPAAEILEQDKDREAAAALAQMAADLADAATPPSNPEDGVPSPGRLTGLRDRIGLRRRLRGRLRISRRVAGLSTGLVLLLNPGRWPRPKLRGNGRRWIRRTGTAVLAMAVVLGVSDAAPARGEPGPSDSPSHVVLAGPTESATPSLPASAAPSSSQAAPSSAPSLLPPSATFAETPSLEVIPSQTAATATIRFSDLVLDSVADARGSVRTFTFVSDGGGIVTAQVVATSTMASTKECLSVDSGPEECVTGATPGFRKTTDTAGSRWTVTLISAGESTPTVDVAFGWPTRHPRMELSRARFQGSPNPDSLRSLRVTFTARAAGLVSFDAGWPPVAVDASLTVSDVSGAAPAAVKTVAYTSATSPGSTFSLPVASGRAYTLVLFNESADSGRPSLTATIAFP